MSEKNETNSEQESEGRVVQMSATCSGKSKDGVKTPDKGDNNG